ncbi:MAG: hypothetical protein ACOYNY_02250 [Caldilineaceae bacterium]
MTTSTPNLSRSPTGCLYLLFMIVTLLFMLSQAEPSTTSDDDS